MKVTQWLICSSSSCGCHVIFNGEKGKQNHVFKDKKTSGLETRWNNHPHPARTSLSRACEESDGWQERSMKYIILFITLLQGDGVSAFLPDLDTI